MNNLQAGFSRVDITPPLGFAISGFFEQRYAIEVLDPIEASVLALSDGETTVLMVTMDILGVPNALVGRFKDSITTKTGVPGDCIYLHGTHTHNGPLLSPTLGNKIDETTPVYIDFMINSISQACADAIADLKSAKMGWAIGKAPNVAFIRRFRMKDGSIVSNPGINNPDIKEPIGEIDPRVNILRFDREGGKTLVLVNFGNHPCVVGGARFSADWPGFLCRTVESALPECNCLFFNGCQGDVNHVNVHPKDTDRYLNYDQDECYKEIRYGYARYMGRSMAGTVLQEYDKCKYIDVDRIQSVQRIVHIPSNMPTADQLPEAYRLQEMRKTVPVEELRKLYPGMMFETVFAEAARMVRLENGPEYFEVNISTVAIGKVAFVGYTGEPFSGVSYGVKEAEGWDVVLPTCTTNGNVGYFPMMADYMEGGYEARSSSFKAGAAEILIEEGKKLLDELSSTN